MTAEQRICHLDMDAAFCQAAYLQWPERLAGVECLLVGGHPERRGVVASCTWATRALGVRSGMPMRQAMKLCPQAVAAPVPWAMVRRKSREVFAVIAREAAAYERASIDEAYLLAPETGEPLEDFARRLRERVLEETGIRVSIGGASRRFLAKMATSHAKPGRGGSGVYVVPAGEELDFLDRHRPGDIPFVGPAFAEALARRGVQTIPAARAIDLKTLTSWLGPARAAFLYERVRGIDAKEVGTEEAVRKSISAETTFDEDVWETAALEEALAELVADVGHTLRTARSFARTVSVKVRSSTFQDKLKSRSLPEPVASDEEILAVAGELLHELRRNMPGRVRLLGVGLSNLLGPGSAMQLYFREILGAGNRR
jgi:DNA polymerase-4